MVRNYQRKPGSRNYRNYDKETLAKCLAKIKSNKMSLSKASKEFKIPKGTLSNKLDNVKQEGKAGDQMYLSVDLEEKLLLTMDTLTKWKVPLDGFSIRRLVKAYLDREKVVHKRFENNMPGVEWVCSFIKRNNLTKRIADNVKAARAKVSEEIISAYFDNLEQSLNEIPPENIFNYDETNVADDPGSKTVIGRRGQN